MRVSLLLLVTPPLGVHPMHACAHFTDQRIRPTHACRTCTQDRYYRHSLLAKRLDKCHLVPCPMTCLGCHCNHPGMPRAQTWMLILLDLVPEQSQKFASGPSIIPSEWTQRSLRAEANWEELGPARLHPSSAQLGS